LVGKFKKDILLKLIYNKIMGKYILIDLEDTVTIHKDKEREKNIILEWLKYNKVLNPEIIYNNPDYKNRNDRIKLLNIDLEIYKKWYKNFKIVEFSVYYKNFFNKEIIINKDTIHFLKNCKIPLILVSNSSPLWIRYILKKYSLENCFKYIFYRTYDFDDIKKPDKKVLDIIENEI
jgi:FMN phosphatase YigB (HAD superfamily)